MDVDFYKDKTTQKKGNQKMVIRTLSIILMLMFIANVEARWCDSPYCKMCNRLFGPMPGFKPIPLPQIDSTPHNVVRIMIKALNLTSEDLIYDLGCGDGRALVEAVRQSGCRAVGVEINPQIAAIAKNNVRRSGVGHHIRITNADATQYKNLSQCTAIFIYLNPPLIKTMIPKLYPTTRCVSYMHPIPGRSSKVIIAPNGAPIYVSIQEGFFLSTTKNQK